MDAGGMDHPTRVPALRANTMYIPVDGRQDQKESLFLSLILGLNEVTAIGAMDIGYRYRNRVRYDIYTNIEK